MDFKFVFIVSIAAASMRLQAVKPGRINWVAGKSPLLLVDKKWEFQDCVTLKDGTTVNKNTFDQTMIALGRSLVAKSIFVSSCLTQDNDPEKVIIFLQQNLSPHLIENNALSADVRRIVDLAIFVSNEGRLHIVDPLGKYEA